MRDFKTLNDAMIAFKQLEDEFNHLKTAREVDWHQRTITNVRPSRESYDVVVRKELRDLETRFIEQSSVAANVDYDVAVFGIALEEPLIAGNDVCPHYIAAFSGPFIKCYAKIKQAATGSPVLIDINLNGIESIFGDNKLTIPVNDLSVITHTTFNLPNINEGDFLTLDVDQAGSSVPGSTLVVKLKFRKQ